jgi:hypothetical protein
MSGSSQFGKFTELIAWFGVFIIVSNALGLMVGAIKPSELFRNIVVALGLAAVPVALLEMLLHLWEKLNFPQEIGLAMAGAVLLLRAIPRRRGHRRGRPESVR